TPAPSDYPLPLHDALPISAAGHAREKASETAQSVRGSGETVRNAVNDIHALVEAVSVIEGQLTGLQEALTQVAQVAKGIDAIARSEEHTSELQSRENVVCR